MNKRTAVVLDDHRIFGEAYAVMLERYAIFDYVHTFDDENDFIQYILKHSLHEFYIFLDYYLKDRNGLSVMADIKRINKHCKIIFLTGSTSWTVISHMESHQPQAILSKISGMDILLTCIQEVEAGRYYLCPEFTAIKEKNPSRDVTFTPREIEMLQMFSEGNTTAKIAEKTFLSKHTIVSHKRNMMTKSGCKTIGQLVAYARRRGVI